jgi:hypothetical protein
MRVARAQCLQLAHLAQGPNLILLAWTRISTAGQPIKPGTTEFEEDPAEDAKAFGALNGIVPKGELLARAHEIASKIASFPR